MYSVVHSIEQVLKNDPLETLVARPKKRRCCPDLQNKGNVTGLLASSQSESGSSTSRLHHEKVDVDSFQSKTIEEVNNKIRKVNS